MESCTDFPKAELGLPVPLLGLWLHLYDVIVLIAPFFPSPPGLQPHWPLLLLQKTRWRPVSKATCLPLSGWLPQLLLILYTHSHTFTACGRFNQRPSPSVFSTPVILLSSDWLWSVPPWVSNLNEVRKLVGFYTASCHLTIKQPVSI